MSGYKRNIKFQYFEIIIENKTENKAEKYQFCFEDWAVYLDKEKLVRKSLELKGLKARIERYENDKHNSNLWIMRFMKLRDTNIPSKVKENEIAIPVDLEDDEYIGEDVTLLYDEEYGIAMIQSNRFSLSHTRIQELMNKINPFEDFVIFINPIVDLSDVKFNNKNSRKITIGFANIKRAIPETKSGLSNIINSYHRMEALSGQVMLGVGRTKKTVKRNIGGKIKEIKEERFLDQKSVEELINDIYHNKDIITNAKLEVRDDDGPNLEILDLFDNVHHDYISFVLEARTTLGFEYISDKMKEIYLKRRATVYRSLVND